jgi:hypothetical protein
VRELGSGDGGKLAVGYVSSLVAVTSTATHPVSGERCRGRGSVREKIVAEVLVLVCFAHQAAILQSGN